ncbi:putative proline/betaine transporter [Rickettsia endosymbiont of Ixodes pacificus]|nr:putative proline/betaine transporter [Rickettsia endosymbiont of Ixodes pacificus]
MFVHCSNILKDSFGYTSHEVIQHNFYVSLVKLFALFIFAYASYKTHPLKVIKVRTLIFSLFLFYLLYNTIYSNPASTPFQLFIIQSFVIVFGFGDTPALPIFLIHFPIFKHFTCASLVFAISHALMYVVTSFGLVYLINYFESWAWGVNSDYYSYRDWIYWGYKSLSKIGERSESVSLNLKEIFFEYLFVYLKIL